jgi:hypothetical protein
LYQDLLRDARFFELLLRFDEDLAREAREAGCSCGGVLHSARYPRKPRGGPPGLGREHDLRASFCCAKEGCRRRVTPPSLRFLGRKVYVAVAVVLVPILRDGPTPERLRRLEQRFGVSRRTLQRWRQWWREVVPGSRRWRGEEGGWAEPVDRTGLPASLLEVFSAIAEPADRVLALLKRLSSWPTGQLEHAR